MSGQSRRECGRPFPFALRGYEGVSEVARLVTLVIPAKAGIQARLS